MERRAVKSIMRVIFGLMLAALLLAPRGHAEAQKLRRDQYSGRYGDLSDIYVNDNTDWWSTVSRDNDFGREWLGDVLRDRAQPANFEILGLRLWNYSVDWPQKIIQELGRTTVIERGDAAVGRSQVCYQSAVNSGQTKLIFETGECTESFYLFKDGAPFSESKECLSSKLVDERIKTPSGLGLALTPNEVIRILGTPSVERPDFLAYRYNVRDGKSEGIASSGQAGRPPLDVKYQNSLYLIVRFRNRRSWYLDVESGSCGD